MLYIKWLFRVLIGHGKLVPIYMKTPDFSWLELFNTQIIC